MRARASFLHGPCRHRYISLMATATAQTPRLSPDEADAWFGVLNAQTALVRSVDAELLAAHRLSCSSHEVLYRLAHADEGHLSIGALGAEVGVGPSDHGLGRVAVLHGGDADAERRRGDALPALRRRQRDAGPRGLGVGIGEDAHELVAAHANHQVVRPHVVEQAFDD